jgi:hypothetical protein
MWSGFYAREDSCLMGNVAHLAGLCFNLGMTGGGPPARSCGDSPSVLMVSFLLSPFLFSSPDRLDCDLAAPCSTQVLGARLSAGPGRASNSWFHWPCFFLHPCARVLRRAGLSSVHSKIARENLADCLRHVSTATQGLSTAIRPFPSSNCFHVPT